MWPFKKRTPTGFSTLVIPKAALEQARAQQVLEGIQQVIKDFASVVQQQDSTMAFYDVSALPHPKELIASSLVASIKLAEGRGEMSYVAATRVMLEALVQYQDGVGKRPALLLPSTEGLSAEETARVAVAHSDEGGQERWARFSGMAASDRRRYALRLTD